MQYVPQKTRTWTHDDFPRNQQMYVLPRSRCREKALHPETRLLREVGAAHSVGARLHGDSGGDLDTPQTRRCWDEVRDVPRTGCGYGCDVSGNERYIDGRLH